jgi:hypothetical protein
MSRYNWIASTSLPRYGDVTARAVPSDEGTSAGATGGAHDNADGDVGNSFNIRIDPGVINRPDGDNDG